MNAAHKGRRAEHRARALLEADGFTVCRAAGTKYASTAEREALQAMARPAGSSVEVWRFPDRVPAPLIESL